MESLHKTDGFAFIGGKPTYLLKNDKIGKHKIGENVYIIEGEKKARYKIISMQTERVVCVRLILKRLLPWQK